ncbi:MAG TPA: LCP family protein, partial [Candidatus Ozemobacteraceae bacterium]|nr:LCP family protein [Candidatus Ozemobacteraceae bacterium]
FLPVVRVIDLLGGVEIDVERRMKYTDNWQKLYIDLMPGLQRLDGQKALQYVRFRADAAADLGRIKRQQKFLAALLQQVKSPGIVIKIPDLVRQALNHIQTDLNVAEVVDLARAMLQGPMKINTQSLPGDAPYINGVSYFVPFKDQAVAIGAKGYSSLVSLELDAGFSLGGASEAQPIPVASAATTTVMLPATGSLPLASDAASASMMTAPVVASGGTRP